MDEEQITQDFQDEEVKIQDYNIRNFKFMENIYVPPSETTFYVEMMEKISGDAKVSIKRILMAMLALGITTVLVINLNVSEPGRLAYTIVPSIFFMLSFIALLILYMMPEKDYSSKLEVILASLFNKITEHFREKAGAKISYPKINFDESRNGLIQLGPDYYGYLFKVVGQLNNTTLAAYVEDLAGVRQSYLVERETTTEELFITKIKTLSYADNLTYFKQKYNTIKDDWSKNYFTKQYNFIDSQIASKEIGFIQYLFISDINIDRTDQAVRILLNSSAEGMYEEIKLIDDEKEIKEILGSPLLVEELNEEGNYSNEQD